MKFINIKYFVVFITLIMSLMTLILIGKNFYYSNLNKKDNSDYIQENNTFFLNKIKSLDSLLLNERRFYERLSLDLKKDIELVKMNSELLVALNEFNGRNLTIEDSVPSKILYNINLLSKISLTYKKDSLKISRFSNEIKRQKIILLKDLKESALKITGSLEFEFLNTKYIVFIADNNIHKISLHLTDLSSNKFMSFDKLSSYLEKKSGKPLMITNAGMFHKDYSPVGLYIDEELKLRKKLDTSSISIEDNFHMYPNGVFCIDTSDNYFVLSTIDFKSKFSNNLNSLKIATQSGPMLVIDSSIHKEFNAKSVNLQIRSGVGKVKGKNKAVFIVSSNPESFYRTAILFRDIFSCENALYLDGAISKIYLPGKNPNSYAGNFGPMIAVSKK